MTRKKRSRHIMPVFTTFALIAFQSKVNAQITIANTDPDAAVNIIYQPYKNLKMGIEENYAKTENFEEMKSDAFRLQFTTSFLFK